MNENKSHKSFVSSLAAKIILRLVTIAAICAALFFGGRYAFGQFLKVQVENKRAAVERELSEGAELVLYKMRYSDILTLKKKTAFSKSYSIVRYSGVLRAGIEDMRECEIHISEDAKELLVKIPPTILLGNDIQSQEVFDEQQRLFNRISTQEVFDQIEAAKQEAADEILAEGLLDDADERAKQVISSLLRSLGFDKVTVQLK